MALRAIKDTFAQEPIYGVEVRRVVKAGSIVPGHYIIDPKDVEEVAQGAYPLIGGTPVPPPRIEPPPDYAAMNLPALKEAALAKGIVVHPDAKKADIVEALSGASSNR
jgi:hypothetical protein